MTRNPAPPALHHSRTWKEISTNINPFHVGADRIVIFSVAEEEITLMHEITKTGEVIQKQKYNRWGEGVLIYLLYTF